MTELGLFEIGFQDALDSEEPDADLNEEYMAGYNAGLISRLYL